MGPRLLAHSIRSRFGAKNRQICGWEQSALSDCAKMRICQMTAQTAARHSGASFGRYTAPNLMICGSADRSRPRLLGREGPRPFGDAGPAFACRHCSNPCLSLVLFLFLPMVSMEETPGGSDPGLNESESFLSFNWTDSTSLRLAKQDPFACAMLDELDEGSVGLSREQSSSSEGLLFSDSDEVAESEDEGMTTKRVCGEEEDIVPCSQPDSDVEICPNDISPQEDGVAWIVLYAMSNFVFALCAVYHPPEARP